MATAVVHTLPHQKLTSYYQPDLYWVVDYTCNWVTAVWHSWSYLWGTNHILRPSLNDKTESIFDISTTVFSYSVLHNITWYCMSVGVIARVLMLRDILATTIYAFEWQVILSTLCVKRRDTPLVIFIPLVKITCDIVHANSHVIRYKYHLSSNDRALVAHALSDTICLAFKRHRSEFRLDLSIWM